MKQILLLSLAAIALLLPREALSQGRQNTDRIDAYKIAFFTRRLNLTPAEAETFWPVYNEFDKKKIQLQQDRAMVMRNVTQNEHKMSDDDLLEVADRIVFLQVEEARLIEALHKRLKEVLPPGKVLRVYQAENMFRNQLLNDLRENRDIRRDNLKPQLNQ